MFSTKLLTEVLSQLLESKQGTHITKTVLSYDLDHVAVGSSKMERIINLVRYFRDNKEDPDTINVAFDLIKELIDKEAQHLHDWQEYEKDGKNFENTYPLIHKLLLQNGLSIIDNELKYLVPESVNIPASQEEIFVLIDKYNFTTSLGHLRQAMDNHSMGRWASTNSQLRTYVESLFTEMAERIYGKAPIAGMKSHNIKTKLSETTPPIFITSLNEWDADNATGFINGFWKRLHPKGSHPGLSDIDDSSFRLHLVLLVTANILKRFDEYMKKKTS